MIISLGSIISSPFHTVALDIWGPISTPDIRGNRLILEGVCYKTPLIYGNLMKFKSNANLTWKSMIATVKSIRHSMSRVRIDNDTIFLCADFTTLCESEGIIAYERSVPYAHWKLGRLERQWRTLTDNAKTRLLDVSLPGIFWGHTFLIMIDIGNRCVSS